MITEAVEAEDVKVAAADAATAAAAAAADAMMSAALAMAPIPAATTMQPYAAPIAEASASASANAQGANANAQGANAAAVAVLQQSSVAGEIYVQSPGDNDVLCGRGGATNNHIGNVRYRILVQAHQNEYLRAAKIEKKEVARSIVSIIRSKGGGFLKKCNDGRVGWTDIGDTKAREKTSQALREGLDVLKRDLEQQQKQDMAGSGLSAAKAAAAAATTAPDDVASPEATVADGKRKAGDDVADDGNNKKKAAKTSPTAATAPEDVTATNGNGIAAAAEAAMLAAPISTANRTSPTLDDTAKAAFTATTGDSVDIASTPGVATATAPELVAEGVPTTHNVPVPAPAPSYFDYSAAFALSTSAGTGGVSASTFNYPGTSSFGGYGYPYPFPGYHPPTGNGYGHYGLGYEANLYGSAAASFGIPAPPVTTHVDDGDAEKDDEIFGEIAQI